MDFFATDSSRMHVSAGPTDTSDPFAEAIGRRFGGAAPTLTAHLVLDKSPLDIAGEHTRQTGVAPSLMARSGSSQATATFSTMSLSSRHLPTADTARFTQVAPKDLAAFLALEPPPLILDVRSATAHSLSHIRGAVSLSAPSTLLKRPNFSLANLATMIASAAAQSAFSAWSSAERILLYDADLSKLADGSGVLGLLRKFSAAGFNGELAWVAGGHNAVARVARECLEAGGTEADNCSSGGFVHAHGLPAEAFHESSTTGKPSYKPNKLQASNPFYDNIRQNRELSHGITERIPLELPREVVSRKHEIPIPWVREIVDNSEQEKGIEALAMQFYRVELGEQRRLQGVMSHHTQESQLCPEDPKNDSASSAPHDPFPFSITAGVEKGVKNRYKNIWPYEHTRVRLHTLADDGSDYVNASFVRPRGTNLQYIATQGPLPATFNDFWTMVWEQNVRIIVMLTRQVEGNQLKCGDYWSDQTYGPLRLQLVATEGEKEEPERVTGFDFGYNPSSKKPDDETTIRRTFALTHTEHPEEPPRKIVQFQFLPWLDMNVPETPAGLLELVKNVREAADDADKYKEAKAPSPVVVHCSAGVGRTGSFVAIDAILDGIRRDLDSKRSVASESPSDDTSESDPETGGEKSTDSVPSSRRRGSFPEVDLATHRKPNGVRTTTARQRQISLRRTVGARKSLGNTSTMTSQGNLSTVAAQGNPSTVARALESDREISSIGENLAGAAAAPGCPVETDSGSTNSLTSSASFNFSAMSLPTNTSQSSLPPKPSLQSTHAWSDNVAKNVSVSDLAAPQPVPPSTHTSTPRPDSEMRDRDRDTFDYVPPRSLNVGKPVSPLASMDEPIREVLEDMREQRMSLCQSLRQYVFVHRAVVEGVLAMVDEEKSKQVGLGAKRHASPTELTKVNAAGGELKIKKRPSWLKDSMVVDS